MSDALLRGKSALQPIAAAPERTGLLSRRRARRLREMVVAYAFLLPAFLIVFIFGLFPLAFSAYESTLTGLNRILGRYDGLGNYFRALDSLAYVLFFWLAIGLLGLGIRVTTVVYRLARARGDRPWALVLPGALLGLALALITRYVFILLPLLLAIPDRLRGQQQSQQLFRQYLLEALTTDDAIAAFQLAVMILVAALVVLWLAYRVTRRSPHNGAYLTGFFQAATLTIGAAALAWLTWSELNRAYVEALENNEGLDLWAQIVTISAGLLLLVLSWLSWRSAGGRDSNVSMALRLAAAAALAVGAWVLIGEIPPAIARGDADWWDGLLVTVYYAVGTIPFQLLISLFLATLLFQNIRGKTFFRIAYFLPYIAPFVGTAAAFRILFSGRANAPVNSLLASMGAEPLRWLNEPRGILQIISGPDLILPEWAVGPSLALGVIMIYGIWTFFGFNTVVFLAGLGSIPAELYEAAAIDGANRWAQFRHVTLPLLSPTIYFLTLWATIGTFKAFNHIYVMRASAALGTTDTASVVIFETFKRDTRFGYASALAILLLLIILLLTLVNNRVASRRVFYG